MIYPVTIKTPDGVERILRFTHGAEMRIQRKLNQPLASLFLGENKMDALRVIHENASMMAYSCLPWENGNPPEGVSEGTFGEMYSPREMGDLVAALFECISQGAVKKKDVLEILETVQAQFQKAITGKSPGDSPTPVLVSKAPRQRRASASASSGTSRRTSSQS